MDFQVLAKQILQYIGGEANITALTHCATRLRFTLKDKAKADAAALQKCKGVLGAVESGGQFQVIIGSEVPKVYEMIMKILPENTDSSAAANLPEGKRSILDKMMDFIAGVFTPILPAIIGAGLIKSVLAIAVLCGIDTKGQTYYFLDFIGDAPLYFLPVMLAYTSAKKMNCNPFVAIGIAGAMIHPKYIALVTDPFNIHYTSFLGLPVTLATYTSSVIPILLTVGLLSYVERFLEKILPKMVKFFLKPLLSMLIVVVAAFIVLGPLGFLIGTGISTGLNMIDAYASWLVPTVVGTAFPLLVMTGMHYGLVPFMIQSYSARGYETIAGPGNLGSNIAQGAAALCVALKTKNPELKQLAFSSGITALLGITEPALYGVTLKIRKALYAVMLGGGVAGFYAGITGVKGYAFCAPGLLSLAAFVGPDGLSNVINSCIAMLISFIVTFGALWFTGFDDICLKAEERLSERKVSDEIIKSPVQGTVLALNEVKDKTFAEGMLGQGIAVEPIENCLVAPVDGEVTMLFPTKHAIGVRSAKGADILLHVGVNTVELEGKYFTAHVSIGDRVKAGQLLLEFEREKIQQAGFSTVVLVILTNTAMYKNIQEIHRGRIEENENLLEVSC